MSLPASIFGFPPRAPSQAEWDALTPAERAQVIDALPPNMPELDALPPEGDPHREACLVSESALREFFGRKRREVYIGVNLAVYYPGVERFSPDLFVVFDAAPGPRMSWMVSSEGRGLDFVLEVLVRGDAAKDLRRNVQLYARLGIPEYFVYDRGRQRLHGYRLAEPGADRYVPIVPQHGFYISEVLGLELALHGGLLYFYTGSARLPTSEEIRRMVEHRFDEAMERVEVLEQALELEAQAREEEQRLREEEQHLREEEQRLREEEQRLREEAERAQADAERAQAKAEQRLAEALAELERLRRG